MIFAISGPVSFKVSTPISRWEIVIEINQVEFDASVTDARNSHLATSDAQ